MDLQTRDPYSQGETGAYPVEGGRRMIIIDIEDAEDVIELIQILRILAQELE